MSEELLQQEQPVEQATTGDQQGEAPQPVESNTPTEEAATQAREAEQLRNFRAMREAAERAQRERDDAVRKAEQYERIVADMYQQRQPQSTAPQEVEEPDVDVPENDDIADNKTVAKVNKALKKQIQALKKQNQDILSQTKAYNSEARFMNEHPDWQRVMSLENIQTLSSAYPELARSINSSSDFYEKAKSTYTLIKKFGIYGETPFESDKQRAVQNIAKPKPLTSISPQQGETPLSRANAFANGLTEELKMQLRKEMAAASKKY